MLFCVDLETTALRPSEGGVVELACVAIREGRIYDKFSTLVWPGRHCLQPGHLQTLASVSGIRVEDLLKLETPDVASARTLWLEWLFGVAGIVKPRSMDEWADLRAEDATGKARPRTPVRVTSYSLAFDGEWLRALPWWLEYHLRAAAPVEAVWDQCVMLAVSEYLGERGQVPRRADGKYRWLKLPAACQALGVEIRETHRALDDATAAAELAIRLGLEEGKGA